LALFSKRKLTKRVLFPRNTVIDGITAMTQEEALNKKKR
jgi:hypothetical protein